MVIDQRRHPVTGRFAEPDVARDHVLENQLAQAIAHIVGNLIGQSVAAIEHGQDDPDDAEVGIEALLDPFDRLEELAEPLEREEFALQRDEEGIGRTERVERQQSQRGWAVDETHIVSLRIQRLPQARGAIIDRNQFDLGSG